MASSFPQRKTEPNEYTDLELALKGQFSIFETSVEGQLLKGIIDGYIGTKGQRACILRILSQVKREEAKKLDAHRRLLDVLAGYCPPGELHKVAGIDVNEFNPSILPSYRPTGNKQAYHPNPNRQESGSF